MSYTWIINSFLDMLTLVVEPLRGTAVETPVATLLLVQRMKVRQQVREAPVIVQSHGSPILPFILISPNPLVTPLKFCGVSAGVRGATMGHRCWGLSHWHPPYGLGGLLDPSEELRCVKYISFPPPAPTSASGNKHVHLKRVFVMP